MKKHGEWPRPPDRPYSMGTAGTIYDGSDPAAAFGIGANMTAYFAWLEVVGDHDTSPAWRLVIPRAREWLHDRISRKAGAANG